MIPFKIGINYEKKINIHSLTIYKRTYVSQSCHEIYHFMIIKNFLKKIAIFI